MGPRPAARHVVLLGPMASGKTTVGKALAAALGIDFIDSDAMVVAATGLSAADLAAGLGVQGLHGVERRVLLAALDTAEPVVIAAAASVVDAATTRRVLAAHTCVRVDADEPTRALRLREGGRRPIDEEEQRLLDERRHPRLDELCRIAVDTTVMTLNECVGVIVDALGTSRRRAT